MRLQTHHAAVVMHRQIRVVVLRVGNKGHGVDEGDGLVIVGEAVGFFDGLICAFTL